MTSFRRFSRAALLLVGCCFFCAVQKSWCYRQKIITSAFIKKSSVYRIAASDRRQCLQESECSKRLPESSSEASIPDAVGQTRRALLGVRGGSSYSYGDDDGYGNYQDGGGGDDGRGYSNDDGYYNRNDGYDDKDRDQGYSPSYGQDRYYEEDYGRNGGGSGNGYYDDEGRYHDDYEGGRGSSTRRKSKTKLPTALTSSNRKLGIMFLSAGAAFTALGITLFFNKTLMRLGNLLFVAGVPLMIGPGRTVGYFLQPKKARATGCLGCGIFLVLVGHPVIGILLEIFGLLNLFGNMFPLLMMMAKNMPVIGSLFGGGNGGGGKRKEPRYDDRYYEDDRYERDS